MIGTCVGGLITFIVTRYSLNKQLHNEKILKDEQLKREQDIAMKIVCTEFMHNISNLISLKNVIIEDQLKDLSFVRLDDFSKLICNDSWNKYKIILWGHQDKKAIERIDYFYFNMLLETQCKVTSLERIKERLKHGLETFDYIKKYQNTY